MFLVISGSLRTSFQEQAAVARHRESHLSPVAARDGGRKSEGRHGDAVELDGEVGAPKFWAEGWADQISYHSYVEQISKIKRAGRIELAAVLLDPTPQSSKSRDEKLTAVLDPKSNVRAVTKSETTYSPTVAVSLPRLITSSPVSRPSAASSRDNSVSTRQNRIKNRDNSKSGAVTFNSLKDGNVAERVYTDKLFPGEEKPKGTSEDNQILPRSNNFQNQSYCLYCRGKHYEKVVKGVKAVERNHIFDITNLNENSAHRKHFSSFFSTSNVRAGDNDRTTSILPDPKNTQFNENIINSKRKRRKLRKKREGNDGNDDSNSLASAANSIKFQTKEDDELDLPISSDATRSFSGDVASSPSVKNRTTLTPAGRAADGGFEAHEGVIVKEKVPQNEAELLVHDRHKLMVLLAHLETECLFKMEQDDAEHAGE